MNIWLAKLGENKLTSINKVQKLLSNEFGLQDTNSLNHFEYKVKGVHFLSYDLTAEGSGKKHHYVDSENRLTAYSGFFVGKNPDNTDFRTAEAIHANSENPAFFDSNISGSYAVLSVSESKFHCFVDNIGSHKVFYFRTPDNHVYVTNYIKLLKLFKNPEINTNAILDWLAFESVLLQETEERDILTLPYYGILRWNQLNSSLSVEQYKDVSDVVYNETPQNFLFDQVVSNFKSSARYLSEYHNPMVTLSGGYDSRLVLSMFWGLNIQGLPSYTFYDNYYDVKISKKVAKEYGIQHKILEFSKKLPTYENLHHFLRKAQYPFFKYSEVFGYLVKNSLKNTYPTDKHRILLMGMGGNSDRRILENNFLDHYDANEVIQRLSESLLSTLNSSIFNKDAIAHLNKRLQTHYSDKYMSVISGRGNNHKLKYFLFKERYEETTKRISAEGQSHYVDTFLPLTMDSFQTLIFNCDEKELHRGRKNSIYHRLFNAFTNGEDKPIHFSSGLHWEASKLSRGLYRLKHKVIEPKIKNMFEYKVKKTTLIKNGFYIQNQAMLIELINENRNSFLWDFFNRDYIIRQFSASANSDNKDLYFVFKHILPILKLEADGNL